MEIGKLSIVGQFMVPVHQNGNGRTKESILNSEEILRFALLHHGFGIQELEYIANKDYRVNNHTELFDVRADLTNKYGSKLTLTNINDFMDEYDIRFIGNMFVESDI